MISDFSEYLMKCIYKLFIINLLKCKIIKKNVFSIVERTFFNVQGFEKVYKTLRQQTILKGQSKSTLNNYVRRIAAISLHFNRLPEHISDEEINGYLTSLTVANNSPSRSNFKHMVYGLRYYFRHINQNNRAINLPSLKKESFERAI